MKKLFISLAILLFLLTGCRTAPAGGPNPCAPGTVDEEILSGGQMRQYRLHIPSSYQAGTAMPLVIGFHGAGSTGPQFEAYTGFSALADGKGFIAVYPQGLGDISNWDTMPHSTDVTFVRDLMDELESRCDIDANRIYATGHSRGGGMANRLGCELADRIAAIGPVSGDYEFGDTCSPSRAVAVAAFHGTADDVLPYNGFGLPGQIHESYIRIGTPVPGWAASWAERDGCSKVSEKVFESGPVSGQGWKRCDAGAEVILYTIQGGTHDWPGAVDAARMLWDFFSRHPMEE